MKNDNRTVVGRFQTSDGALSALKTLRQAGFTEARAFSPVPNRNIEIEIGGKIPPLSVFALLGALAGAAAGLLLTVGTSLQHPIMTGGQPIISLPPFFVITFELTILFGVLGTTLAMIWSVRRGRGRHTAYDSRYSIDRIGLEIQCSPEKIEVVRTLLSTAGAEEVRDEKS